LKRIEKGFDLLQKEPREHCSPLQSGPWPVWRRRQGRGDGVPARGVVGGEGRGAREHERLEAHLLGCLREWIKGRRGLAGEEATHGGGAFVGDGVPAGERRR